MNKPQPRIAIIGAGLAGLSCANALQSFACDIRVFEKSVFAGGRLSSHQVGAFEFNNGSPSFQAHHPLFIKLVEAWMDLHLVREWQGWYVCLDQGEVIDVSDSPRRYGGVPTMRALPKNMAQHCDVHYGQCIQELERSPDGWNLFNQEGSYQGTFDAVISASEVAVTADLLSASALVQAATQAVSMAPVWCVLVAFDSPLPVPFDAAETELKDLSCLYRTSVDEHDLWVLYADSDWSARHNKHFRSQVEAALMASFWAALGLPAREPVALSSCFWKAAWPARYHPQKAVFDAENALGACGDWCGGNGVESAVLSGLAMAEKLVIELSNDSLA